MSDFKIYQIIILDNDSGEVTDNYFTNEHISTINGTINDSLSVYDSEEELKEAESEEED